jgi:hypothetical protein
MYTVPPPQILEPTSSAKIKKRRHTQHTHPRLLDPHLASLVNQTTQTTRPSAAIFPRPSSTPAPLSIAAPQNPMAAGVVLVVVLVGVGMGSGAALLDVPFKGGKAGLRRDAEVCI